jgi:hypothetical protein
MQTCKALITDTNVKKEYIDELFDTWLAGQIGRGEDKREPIKRQKYHIKLEVDLTNDTFYCTSNTGNKGLTTGIILNSVGKWTPLSH